MRGLREYALAGSLALTGLFSPLYGCATIPAGAHRMSEQLNEVKNPLQLPSRLTRGVRDAVLGGIEAGVRDPLLQTEQYKETGVVVGTIRDNPVLDIATEIAIGAGIGAVYRNNEGVFGYIGGTEKARIGGAALGAGAAAVSRGIEEAVKE